MGIKFSNFAASISQGAVAAGDASITLQQNGDLFPVLGVGDYFYAVLVDNLISPTKREVIKVAARTGNVLSSITRGVDGTSAQSFALAYVQHRWVRQAILDVSSGSISGALLAANNLSDVLSIPAARANLGLDTGDSPTFANLTVSVLTTLKKLILQKTVTSGSEILISSELGVTDSNGDSAAIRGFIAAGPPAVNHHLRAVEAQVSRQAGTGGASTWGIEVGVHSQVPGVGGTSNIGIVCLSSHTGWLPTGVRNDIAFHAAGEDGWLFGYTYYDIDNATLLYSVDQFGLVYGRTAMFGSRRLDQNLTTPRLCLQIAAASAAATETRFSIYYDSVGNRGVIEALTQGTAWRNLLLAPSGGNTLIGTLFEEDTTHRLQVGGPIRGSLFVANRTWTDAANFERITLGWTGAAGRIHVENLGTGVARALGIYAGAGIFFGGGGVVNQWSISAAGHLLGATDNNFDIGAFGATRPRNIYVGSAVFNRAPRTITAATDNVLATDTYLIANLAGTVTLTLPPVASNTGRKLVVKTIQAQLVVSDASNVVPRVGGAAGTAILAAVDGAWAMLACDGTNWEIMASS